jgi:type II secretory pathway component PulK
MTDYEPRGKGMRVIAAVTLVALVVGFTGGFLIRMFTSG